jgi:protein-tyrosine phosphatase
VLFRSTDLDRLDTEDPAIARLGLRTVIDLRTEIERQAQPDRLPAGATHIVCDVLADSTNSAPALLPKVIANPKDADQILGGGKAVMLFERGYRDIVALPSAIDAYRLFFTTLADDDRRPVLFHCTTGKDRTGWAAAVTLTLLGVSEDNVMRDYLLTNEQLLPALQPVVERFRAAGGNPELLKPVLGVRPDYLNAAFNEMRKRFGSMEGYLTEGLGIDEAMQERLREILTEEAAP